MNKTITALNALITSLPNKFNVTTEGEYNGVTSYDKFRGTLRSDTLCLTNLIEGGCGYVDLKDAQLLFASEGVVVFTCIDECDALVKFFVTGC